MFDGALNKVFDQCKQSSLTSDLTHQLATLELFTSSQPLAKVSMYGVCVCVWWGEGGGDVVCIHCTQVH